MYNKQLDTFVKVVERGSFSAAAQELYVTPSAVIQQIKNLEQHVGVVLLERTSQGVTPTEAGSYLFEESKGLIARSTDILNRLRQLQQVRDRLIRMATSPLHPPQLIYELWFRFHEKEPEYEIETKTFPFGLNEGMETIDLVEGLSWRKRWHKDFTFVELVRTPVSVGVFDNHPLANKKLLSYEDLRGLTVVTICRGMEDTMDRLADRLTEAGSEVITVDIYDNAMLTMSATQQYAILMPNCWRELFPSLKMIPCDWSHTLSYGFYVSPKASPQAKRFVEFMREYEGGNRFLSAE